MPKPRRLLSHCRADPAAAAAPAGATLPTGYVIGPDDVLSIVFWRDKEMSADVVVRPDGRISLPLLNDVQAAGITPEQLRAQLEKSAAKYIAEPNATVIVKTINSRKVLHHRQRSEAGHVSAERRHERAAADCGRRRAAGVRGQQEDRRHAQGRGPGCSSSSFNYKDVVKQKNVQQNIALKPGDTVVVP